MPPAQRDPMWVGQGTNAIASAVDIFLGENVDMIQQFIESIYLFFLVFMFSVFSFLD